MGHPLPRASLLATLLVVGCAGRSGPVVVGVSGPFSEPRGTSIRLAARLAEQQINARGGVGGRQLRLVFVDDSGTDDGAVRAATRLADSARVLAVVGHLSSGPTRAALGVYTNRSDPVPVISPSASSPDLSGISPWFFRVCPSDLAHGTQLARFARERLGATRAAVVFTADDYGRGVRRTFTAEFRHLGGVIVEQDPYLATHGAAAPYVTRLRDHGGVDVLVLATQRVEAEAVLREMRAAGVHWPVVGGDALSGIETDGPLAEGVRQSAAYLPDRASPENTAFVTAYAAAYQGQRPDHRGAATYDIVHLLALAITNAGASRGAVRDYLARVGRGQPAYDGVTGRIAFDSLGDVPGKPVLIAAVRGGRLGTEWQP